MDLHRDDPPLTRPRTLDRRRLRGTEAISAIAILCFAAIFAVRVADLMRAALG